MGLPSELVRCGGLLGEMLDGGLRCRLRPLVAGICPDNIFPVPCMSVSEARSVAGRALSVDDRFRAVVGLANIQITCLNLLYAGGSCYGEGRASAAQRRLQAVQLKVCDAFVVHDVSWPAKEDVFEELARHLDYGGDGGKVLPLTSRCGVPQQAGGVDLASVLEKSRPEMHKQILFPRKLMLKKKFRPHVLKRPFVKVGGDYKQFVAKCVKNRLMDVVPRSQIWKHNNKLVYSGAFAVAKDEVEDRFIMAACPNNQLLDRERLPRPQFAYIPKMRSLLTTPGRHIVIYKRDARHYFFQLSLHRRWRKFLGMPPIRDGNQELYPRQCCAPMGFAPSAGWAHGLTEVCAEKAELPTVNEVKFGRPPPPKFSSLGSYLGRCVGGG